MGKEVGLKPRDRKLATTSKGKLTGNQWQNTPQQNLFMKLWVEPTSKHFGNAHAAALAAGYSENYANQLTAPTIGSQWLTEYKRRVFFTDEHIRQGIQGLAKSAENAKSPDDTRLKAFEILAKISGMVDNRSTTVNIVQPILAGVSYDGRVASATTSSTVSAKYSSTSLQEDTHVEEGQLIPE